MDNKKSLLVVDDENMIVDMLYDHFRRDYTVHKALSGQEALDILKENQINVVMTDQRMPGMTGTELLAKLKNENPEITRILMTGYTEMEVAIEAINKGSIFQYLSKPIQMDTINSIIEEGMRLFEEASEVKSGIDEEKEKIISKVKGIFSELKTIESGREDLEKELQTVKESEERAQTELVDKINTLEEANNKKEQEIGDLNSKVADLSSNLDNTRSEAETKENEAQGEINNLNGKINELQVKAERINEEFNKTRSEAEKKERTATNEIHSLNEKILRITEELEKLQADAEKAKGLVQDNERMQEELKDLESRFSLTNQTLLTRDEEIKKLEQSVGAALA